MKLKLCDEIFTIKKLDKQVAFNKTIFCLINEYDGPSVIETISKNSTASLKFRAFYIDELDDFSQSGILFHVLKLLKKIISAFLVVSAFSRDYIFVQEADFEKTRLLLGI
ncbi:hypothetical protein CHLV4088_09040 [Campylobacter helveticus]|uniref:hypothetical protein n=1 Tax=Campylobacter helveticus TaxID=28898 RepID=UPI00214A221A|nr:hypothetical protein [Campylobacter helveticus]MCR2057536.1 hypothetical protein [Campylobacter helveticus]